ncbi:hypothetical protein GTO91_08725 [Heliobacterium undosum]|uniref:Class III cytochrome C domain-containing protein n=1 Tax=Heliomicrobium undosum TaxID=121734 RepID=A0A845L7T3_9FIRM|nr:cytochrome c3 family protein [Heliomicrobium undosum]MZP29788.1 hypothetical protein [Heliomicrobium undosum]
MTPGIKKIILLSFALIAVCAVAFSLQEHMLPESFYSPGHLSEAHAENVAGCADCHRPWTKVTSESCATADCHSREKMALQMTKDLLSFHEKKQSDDCMTCHREHRGATATASAQFDHSMADIKQRCAECHEGPKNHEDAFGNDCAACHSVEAWKPATFDHSKYFRLTGDHQLSCAECHPGGDYKTYTCVSCHSESEMLREHHTSNYARIENCVECHNGKRSFTERSRRDGADSFGDFRTDRFKEEPNGEYRSDRSLREDDRIYRREDGRRSRDYREFHSH